MKDKSQHDTLGNRMKSYEELSTSRTLMPNTPIYARIDGRAFHTFCHGLEKPYSKEFIDAMQFVTRKLVKDFNAIVGYVQSDEISLGWDSSEKAPFDGRVQKLESVLASAAGSYFNFYIFGSNSCTRTLRERAEKHVPTFDCRCFNVPSMDELANSFLWRENDAIKNSCTGMALHFYSHRELDGKNTDEKVHMMRMKGHCFYEDTDEDFLRGAFFRRVAFEKVLSEDEISRIPERNRPPRNADGNVTAIRSDVVKIEIPYRLTEISNKCEVLFEGADAVLKVENPTFNLSKSKTVDTGSSEYYRIAKEMNESMEKVKMDYFSKMRKSLSSDSVKMVLGGK